MSIFSTTIKEIGPDANDFLNEGMLVLFGMDAPPELRPFCFLINLGNINDKIEMGNFLIIDDVKFKVTAVGNQVEKNLRDLGHITINFNGEKDAELAGTLYVENREIPTISVGSKISIV